MLTACQKSDTMGRPDSRESALAMPDWLILRVGIPFAPSLVSGSAKLRHAQRHAHGKAGGMAYRILLVEDEADFREPLAILLDQDGYNVQAAANGQEALEGLAGQSYDIIVSDLRMPGIDGEQLFRRIEREWPHLASRVV